MKALLDTNVVFAVLLDRAPFADAADEIFAQVEAGALHGLLCATTVTTIEYLLTNALDRKRARRHVKQLLALFEVAAVTRHTLDAAVNSRLPDFEDAVLAHAALAAGCDIIIPRNGKDFSGRGLPVLISFEYLASL